MPNERVSTSKLKQLIGPQSSNLSVRALSRALGLSATGTARLQNRRWRGRQALRSRARAKGVRHGAGQIGHPGGAGLRVDPRRAKTPPARHPAAAVGGIQRRARRGGVPKKRVLPDLPGLGEAPEALDAPTALRRRDVRRLRRPYSTDLRYVVEVRVVMIRLSTRPICDKRPPVQNAAESNLQQRVRWIERRPQPLLGSDYRRWCWDSWAN